MHKVFSNVKYAKSPCGQWDFSRQYTMVEPHYYTRTRHKKSFRVMETNPTIRVNMFSMTKAFPGQKVWVIRYHKPTNRFRVVSDIVMEVHCFGPLFAGYLRHYWLRHGYHNTGLDFGTQIWFTRNQAEYALKKLNYFADHTEQMEILKEFRSEK